VVVGGSHLRVIAGRTVQLDAVPGDPWEFQALCVDAFVASWHARGFSPVTIENDTGLLERVLDALGRPVPRQVVGRDSSVSKVGMVGSARPRWTSSGRFQAIASCGRSVLYSTR